MEQEGKAHFIPSNTSYLSRPVLVLASTHRDGMTKFAKKKSKPNGERVASSLAAIANHTR
jgi:hypothetical protein